MWAPGVTDHFEKEFGYLWWRWCHLLWHGQEWWALDWLDGSAITPVFKLPLLQNITQQNVFISTLYTGFTCVTVKLLHIHTHWNKRWWFYVIPCLSVVMWMNEERCFLPFGNPPASAPRFRLQVSGPGRGLWIPPFWWSLFHSYTLKGQTVTQPSRHFKHFKNMLMTNISK